jgi:5-methylcytosine-specific restriction endonuclease McrA
MRKVDKELLKHIRNDKKCIICYTSNPDPHHVKSKKSGGDDVEANLMPLCRICHTQVHKIGLNRFADKYPSVKGWLLHYGWEINPISMKWFLPKAGTIE